jgi:hypothetical protein
MLGVIPNGELVELWAGTFRARLGTVIDSYESMQDGETTVAYTVEFHSAYRPTVEVPACDVRLVEDEHEDDWVNGGVQACYGGQWTIHEPHTVEGKGCGVNRGMWVRWACPGKTREDVLNYREGITETEPILTGFKRSQTRAEIEGKRAKRK